MTATVALFIVLFLVESIAKDAPLTQTQKILYGLFTVGGQYAWTRANRYITSKGWGELDESDVRNKVYRVLQTGEKYWKAFSLINFLVFLWNGKYRTLIDRVLAMRLVYSKKSMNRQVSFEFLNRQMVWHAFTVSSEKLGAGMDPSSKHNFDAGILAVFGATDQCREAKDEADAHVAAKVVSCLVQGIRQAACQSMRDLP